MNVGNTPSHIRIGIMLALLATKMWVPVCQEAGGGHRTILYASGAFAA